MIRVITYKEYEKMTHPQTGRWRTYFKPNLTEPTGLVVKRLKEQGYMVKVYVMTTRVRGYYD